MRHSQDFKALKINPFKLFDEDWGLVTAGTPADFNTIIFMEKRKLLCILGWRILKLVFVYSKIKNLQKNNKIFLKKNYL